ncbi:DUF6607 family protein [Constantimarinum furrinae]|uniref:Uncharacterized protein n=1 Tax=Constantimarinum furrinae TaxID=2562285 RepID=A0A7G8PXT0_9FLAO|nr:DUF6607 family protein [Constantimarinum furrinae]QNJ99146.1 hypothetical protein ALE3EI_2617 [Constantimarinum furrinae]
MKQLAIFSVFLMIFSNGINAQTKKELDQKAIKSMCGCYEVSFNFAETFKYSEDPNYTPSTEKHDSGLEWVELVEDSEDKIVLQHLLIVGNPASPKVIKHWRQDWLFENTDLYEFNADNTWTYNSLAPNTVKGQWTQKVFQVDDSPRYEGTATWVHVDGISFWENTTPAPLPRREYTKRSDYNLTMRTNKHVITKDGWLHDQDNQKIIRKKGEDDKILAEEKGLNKYVKVEDSRCQAALTYWNEKHKFWSLVRSKWDEVFGRKKDLHLNDKVEGKALYQYLFSDEITPQKKEIDKTVESFVID